MASAAPRAKASISRKRLSRAKRASSKSKLLKLVAKNRPPQEWFEQNVVPFTPSKD